MTSEQPLRVRGFSCCQSTSKDIVLFIACHCYRRCWVYWYVHVFCNYNPRDLKDQTSWIGSHIVLTLLLTRRFKVISIDNHHNSHSLALSRVSRIAFDALPANPSDQDKESALVDSHTGDLTKAEEVTRVFEQYGKGVIWGVIHVAVRRLF